MRNFIFKLLVIFCFAELINNSPCSDAGQTASSYKDCKPYTNDEAETICCYYASSESNSDKSSSCIEMDKLFEGKTIQYSNDVLKGTLYCSESSVNTDGYTASQFIKFNLMIIFACIGLLIL